MEELVCNICHEDIREGNEVGEINSCTHRFCYPCIAKWATIENICPCCRVRFNVLKKLKASSTPGKLANLPPTAPIPGVVLAEERCEEVNQRPIFEDPSFEQWIQNVVCLVCGNADNEDRLLLCDDCDGACHTYCVGLRSIPEGEWFCTGCSHRRENAAVRQRQRLRQQDALRSRRRRIRQRNLIISDDDEEFIDDDEVEIVDIDRRSNRRNRGARGGATTATVGGVGARAGAASIRDTDNLDGFIVSDSDDQSNSEYEDHEEVRLEEAPKRRIRIQNGSGATVLRRGGRGAGGGGGAPNSRDQVQRQRHQRATHDALDSDFEEEVDWAEFSEEEEEELDLDSPLAAGRANADGWRRVRRGNSTTTTTSTRNRNTSTATTIRPSRRRQNNPNSVLEEDDGFSPADTARHAVEVLTNNWEQIRRGTTSFNQVLGNTSNNNNPRRSRQGREAAREANQATRETDVVDLTISPEPAAVACTAAKTKTKSKKESQKQQQHAFVQPLPPPTTARPGLSPPLGISLSSRLRAELNACREKGAKLPPRQNNNGASTSTAAASRLHNNTPEAYFAAAVVAATLDNTDNNSNDKRNKKNSNSKKATVPPPSSSYSPTRGSPGSSMWRRTNNTGSSPGSGGPYRMRTVHDVHQGAEVARRTPNSTGSGGVVPRIRGTNPYDSRINNIARGSVIPGHILVQPTFRNSPAPLQQRLAARAAAEWGGGGTTTNNNNGASGSGGGSGGNRSNNDISNAQGRLPALPQPGAWRQAKRPPQQPLAALAPPRALSGSRIYQPMLQQQQQQQQHQPLRRDIPMFLRNNSTNPAPQPPQQQQQQQQQLQSPSYSLSSVPRNRHANNRNNNAPGGTTPPATTATTPEALAKLKKQQAYDAVRSHAKLYYSEGAISREQYKKVARIATHKLYERHGGNAPDEIPSSQEAALVVDEALFAVIRGEI